LREIQWRVLWGIKGLLGEKTWRIPSPKYYDEETLFVHHDESQRVTLKEVPFDTYSVIEGRPRFSEVGSQQGSL
jgi:hypothetical protein